MLFSRALLAVTALFAASSQAQISLPIDLGNGDLLGGGLGLDLLGNNSLVNLDAFLNVASASRCPSATVGLVTALSIGSLNVLSLCVCVNALDLLNTLFQKQTVCPPCADPNSSAICGNGKCACACNAGFYSDSITGKCVPVTNCPSPNIIAPNGDGTSFCQCVSPFVSNGAGGCTMPTTMSARSRHRKAKKSISHPHAARASQEVLAPSPLKPIDPKSETCPDGETACRLSTGGFECIDTTNALNSCGGCVGEGLPGQNCLAIAGALNVQCEDSACKVSSCFKGWSLKAGKCV